MMDKNGNIVYIGGIAFEAPRVIKDTYTPIEQYGRIKRSNKRKINSMKKVLFLHWRFLLLVASVEGPKFL